MRRTTAIRSQINVYLDRELRERMSYYTNINWSALAQKAFKKEMDRVEAEEKILINKVVKPLLSLPS